MAHGGIVKQFAQQTLPNATTIIIMGGHVRLLGSFHPRRGLQQGLFLYDGDPERGTIEDPEEVWLG